MHTRPDAPERALRREAQAEVIRRLAEYEIGHDLSSIAPILLSPPLYARVRRVTDAPLYDPTAGTDHFRGVVSLAL